MREKKPPKHFKWAISHLFMKEEGNEQWLTTSGETDLEKPEVVMWKNRQREQTERDV